MLPAQAGVVPGRGGLRASPSGAPRSGGGGPRRCRGCFGRRKCSPLRRGWSLATVMTATSWPVLPAQAGVVPVRCWVASRCPSAPRSGGGGPIKTKGCAADIRCSPLRRGWSHEHQHRHTQGQVLPAQAGVVQIVNRVVDRGTSAPRSGGGGPQRNPSCLQQSRCSPLRRGWSLPRHDKVSGQRCSPLRQGWSLRVTRVRVGKRVLPAQAGVVPVPGRRP